MNASTSGEELEGVEGFEDGGEFENREEFEGEEEFEDGRAI